MNPKELEEIPIRVEKLFYDMQTRVMEDVVRRIKKTGGITSTADYQIEKMRIFGNTSEFIESEIKRTTNMVDPELWKLYDNVVDKDYTRNKSIYEQVNAEFIPYSENELMKSWTDAIVKQTKDEIVNLTQSMGFALIYGNKMVFTPFSEYYQKHLDRACMDVVTGSLSYNTVLRRIVKEMTASGIRSVDYASGHSNRATVAARRAVMTGVNQLSGKINDKNAEQFGTDTFEVTAHANARPSHRDWQGRVYTKKQLISICGLGSVDGLEGANCRHNHMAFIRGVSVRTYTNEQLDEMARKEDQGKTWLGKQYTGYEATQQQRSMETLMRKQRSDIKLLKSGKASEDDIMNAQAKYLNTLHQYQGFSKKMRLPEQMERVYIDGLGRVVNRSGIPKMKISLPNDIRGIKGVALGVKNEIEESITKLQRDYDIKLSSVTTGKMGKRDLFGAGPYIDDDGNIKFGLVINEDMDYSKVIKRISNLYDSNFMAGKSIEDYICHEMAHIMTFQDCVTKQEYDNLQKIINKQFIEGISGYSDKSGLGRESLAEAFVRYRNGEEIPVQARILINTYIERWKKI